MLLLLPVWVSAQILDWAYDDILTDEQASGANPDFFMHPDGDISVSYWDGRLDILMYGKRSAQTSQWTWERVAPALTSHGYKSALTVDANGAAHIAFLDGDITSNASLRYATNASGSWVLESPMDERSVGPYGFDVVAPRFSQGSLDIAIKPDGQPFISFFDGNASVFLNNCPPTGLVALYNQYKLDLGVVERSAAGTWVEHLLPDVPFERGISCLLQGDRFGEFCKIIPRADGRFLILTNSMHNHHLLLFRAEAGDLANWEYQKLDSVERILPATPRFFESFEHMTALIQRDSIIHLASSISELFGFNDNVNRSPLVYHRLRPDSLGASTFSSAQFRQFVPNGIFRSYLSLASRHPDSIFISYVNVKSNLLAVQSTRNAGAFWQLDTLGALITDATLNSQVIGDSLFIWAYDRQKDAILEISCNLSLTQQKRRYLTVTERRGDELSSQVRRNGSDDEIYMAFSEAFEEKLVFGERKQGTFTFETVLQTPGLRSIFLSLDPADQPGILFTAGSPEQVSWATRQGGVWDIEPVSATPLRNLHTLQTADSIYAAGYDFLQGVLMWMGRAQSGGAWKNIVLDTINQPTGQSPVIREHNGTLFLAYLNRGQNQVKLATRPQGQSWTVEEITLPFNYNPLNLDLQISTLGVPSVAFKDGTSNRIYYAQRDQGAWNPTPVLNDPGNLVGIPLRLILDTKDRPWILFNFPDVQDELRLLRQDEQGNWVGVSVSNNQAQVAGKFDFHLLGDDFYVIGTKKELGNQGLGLLYAEEGVRTLLPKPESRIALTLIPNPTNGAAALRFSMQQAGTISLDLYNLQGQLLHHENAWLSAGEHSLALPSERLVPGSYLIKVKADAQHGRTTLVKLP